MNCIDVREMLSMYIDDELDTNERSELEVHLAGCDECMREYDALLEMTLLLRAVPRVSLPVSFDERLRSSIETSTRKQLEYKKRWRTFSAIAAVFVIGIFSITMYNHMDHTDGLQDELRYAQNRMSADRHSQWMDGRMNHIDSRQSESTSGRMELDDRRLYGLAEGHMGHPGADDIMPFGVMNNMDQEVPQMYAGQGSRPMTVPDTSERSTVTRGGINQNEAMRAEADFYLRLIEEKLRYYNHSIIDYWRYEDGVWNFQVEIKLFGESHAMVTKMYMFVGQDGELWRKDL